jgi:hypothetical protein
VQVPHGNCACGQGDTVVEGASVTGRLVIKDQRSRIFSVCVSMSSTSNTILQG